MRKMLKRVLVLALAAAMTLSLAACGGTKKDNASYTYNKIIYKGNYKTVV